MTELVLPNDANTLGNLLGGRLMHYIDLVAAMAAYRHSRTYVVTASMDHIDFIAPVRCRGSGDSEVHPESRFPNFNGGRRQGVGATYN